VITHSIEIDRRPEEVFAYLDQPQRHGEWQSQIVSARVEGEGPVGVGTRVKETRKIGNREQDTSYEITEHDPPRRSSFRGTAGPVRPVGTVTVEAIGDGSRSRVTLEFDLVGQGMMGKLIAPMARSQARKSIPESQEQLKAKLESGEPGPARSQPE
jgi:carbon monoxide dehydrogenase subunit G